MKKIISLIGIIGFVFTFVSCSKSPSTVSKQFYEAVRAGNTAPINELMRPEAAEMALEIFDAIRESVVAQGKVVKTEEQISGNTAIVKVYFEDGTVWEDNHEKWEGKWQISELKK